MLSSFVAKQLKIERQKIEALKKAKKEQELEELWLEKLAEQKEVKQEPAKQEPVLLTSNRNYSPPKNTSEWVTQPLAMTGDGCQAE